MKREINQIQYLEIIKEAFRITWKNRYLWWFGLLASLTSTGSTFSNLWPDSGTNNPDNQSAEKFFQFLHNNLGFIVMVAVVILIIFIALAVLGILGRGALIKAIARNLKGEVTGFKSGLRESKKYFWRILAIDLLILFSFILVLVVLAIPVIFLFANKNILAGLLLTMMAIAIMIPIILLVVFLRMYGYLYVVLGELGFWHSLENAYLLLKNNLASSLVLFLLFVPLGFVMLAVIMAIFIPLVIIFLIIGVIAYLVAQSAGAAIVALLGILFFIVIIFFIKAVYETFAQTVWILFFREIASPKVTEKVAEKVTEPKSIVEPDVASGI